MSTNKKKKAKHHNFFGCKSHIEQRYLFVDELGELILMEDRNKNLFIEINGFDSHRDEYKMEKVTMVLHPIVYDQLFFFLYENTDAARNFRNTLFN